MTMFNSDLLKNKKENFYALMERASKMTGTYHIIVEDDNLIYEFDILRNITILRGDTATGKTTLYV